MRATIRKWGNSASVRIPIAVMKAAGLKVDEPVDVREESGAIVIEPFNRKEYDIHELVKKIKPKHLHEEIDAGGRVGNEVW